jgi:hypothetical protein
VNVLKSLTLEAMTTDRATLSVGHLYEAALVTRRETIKCSKHWHGAAELRASLSANDEFSELRRR